MVSMVSLDEWKFLVGRWKGRSSQDNEFGEEGIVEGYHVFSLELDKVFIMGRHDSYQVDQTVNKTSPCSIMTSPLESLDENNFSVMASSTTRWNSIRLLLRYDLIW